MSFQNVFYENTTHQQCTSIYQMHKIKYQFIRVKKILEKTFTASCVFLQFSKAIINSLTELFGSV